MAASIKALLLNQARNQGEEFERTLVRYAAERLLYRLGASPVRDRCILKGASLLTVWLPDPYRVTRDVDLLAVGASSDDAIRLMLEEICAVPCPEDALRFDLSNLELRTIRPAEEYSGKRARFQVYLGAARIQVQMDIGFGDALATQPEEIEYPTLLRVLPKPRLRGYPREAAVAEKFEAMVKLGIRNSRMKDFHDVWALAGSFEFKGERLQEAIATSFERRGTQWTDEVPSALTAAFYQIPEIATRWKRYLVAGSILSRPPGCRSADHRR